MKHSTKTRDSQQATARLTSILGGRVVSRSFPDRELLARDLQAAAARGEGVRVGTPPPGGVLDVKLGRGVEHIEQRACPLRISHRDRSVCSASYADGGAYVELKDPHKKFARAGGGRRRRVWGFSSASRRRLLKHTNSVDRRQVRAEEWLFITLTYPGQWSKDPRQWKRDLDTFWKRMEREYGLVPGWWKLEPQKRGAPHFHLLIRLYYKTVMGGLEGLQKWLSKAWFEVVGSGDEKHLRAGTRAEVVRTWRGVIAYAAKYLGKDCSGFIDKETGEVLFVGRMWGCRHKRLIPVQIKWVVLLRTVLAKLRREFRRLVERKGRKYWSFRRREGYSVSAFVNSTDFVRLLEWAEAQGP
jgi:hypothetical protein